MPTHIRGIPRKEYFRAYYHTRRAKLIDYLGGKCKLCGVTANLEFDHIDRAEKTRDISRRLTLRNAIALSEINKCQLLCEVCHNNKTAKENSRHGIGHALKKKCKCEACALARHTWYDKRNAARRTTNGIRGPYNQPSAHGTRKTYNRGCRCVDCKTANSKSERDRRALSGIGETG